MNTETQTTWDRPAEKETEVRGRREVRTHPDPGVGHEDLRRSSRVCHETCV